jgi:ubiquitin-protein ligase
MQSRHCRYFGRAESPCPATPENHTLQALSELLTPKASGSSNRYKRRQINQQDDAGCDNDGAVGLERSLKRFRVTSWSPGELCLQRDLRHLVNAHGWKNTQETSFEHEKYRCLLRNGAYPTELILQDKDVGAQVHLHIQKLYPHCPPKITRIEYNTPANVTQKINARVESIIIADEMQPRGLDAAQAGQNNSRVILNNWTPIRRLGDCLIDIINVLRNHTADNLLSAEIAFEDDRTSCGLPLRAARSEESLPSDTVSFIPLFPEGDAATERHVAALAPSIAMDF